jgi:hypothetical protein
MRVTSVMGAISASESGGGGGATQVFTYPNFSSTTGMTGNWENTTGGKMQICGNTVHDAGQDWRTAKQNIQSFTTEFVFSVGPGNPNIGYGFTFVIQNDPNGLNVSGDSNGLGFAQYTGNVANYGIVQNAVELAFNSTPNQGTGQSYFGTYPSAIGLYLNGGPFLDNGLSPTQDLIPQGINLWEGHDFQGYVVYDGTILSVKLTDLTTGGIAYFEWPVDIPTIVKADNAYIGFTAGAGESSPAVPQTVNSWTWWSGYNARLATPTISPAAGQYASAQTVSLSGPGTIHYTTDGTPATVNSTAYSAPFTVSASAVVHFMASETNYTDSYQGLADYQIQAAGVPKINYPSGFTTEGRIALNGTASIIGSAIALTDTQSQPEVGSAFYLAPVDVASFSTVFEFQCSGSVFQNGLAFVLQNVIPTSVSNTSTNQSGTTEQSSVPCVSGGPYALGYGVYGTNAIGAGYAGIMQSVAMVFDGWNNKITQVSNGAMPNGTGSTPTGINLQSGHLMQATVGYDGTTLSLTLKDTNTSTTYSTSWTVDIPTLVGASTAYAGFTAAEYTPEVEQTVTNWTYTEG